jgi:hypothetical protein
MGLEIGQAAMLEFRQQVGCSGKESLFAPLVPTPKITSVAARVVHQLGRMQVGSA